MTPIELLKQRRTVRKFAQDPIPAELLTELTELARLAPSGANKQPIRYLIIDRPDLVRQVHPLVAWAGYTRPQGVPAENELPVAYIMLLGDTTVKANCAQDEGITGEAMICGAALMGLGACWLGAIQRKPLAELFALPAEYEVLSMIALGYPAQQPVQEDDADNIKYYFDEQGTLHVPKLPAEKVTFRNSLPK